MHQIRTKNYNFSYINQEESADITHQKVMITRALKYLDIACKQLKRIEDDLSQFLSEYYARVGALFEELELLQYQLAAFDNVGAPALHSDHPKSFSLADASGTMIDQEMKGVYRSLAKIYHPDSGQCEESEDTIKLINDAYAQRSLSALRRIEFEIMENGVHNDMGDAGLLQRLRGRYEAVVSSITQINHRRKTLLDSPTYHLKQRVWNAKLLGYDLVSTIESDTKIKIEECKQALTFKRRMSQAMPAAIRESA